MPWRDCYLSITASSPLGKWRFALGDKIDLSAFAPSSFVGLLATAGAVGPNEVGYMVNGTVTTIYVDTDGIFGADLEIYVDNYIPVAGGADFIFV